MKAPSIGRGGRGKQCHVTFVYSQGAAMLVPRGIKAEDAVYLPSVETALSLVQDAGECRPCSGAEVGGQVLGGGGC